MEKTQSGRVISFYLVYYLFILILKEEAVIKEDSVVAYGQTVVPKTVCVCVCVHLPGTDPMSLMHPGMT